MLDVFNSDAFGILPLTDSFNNLPFVPGRLGALGVFAESGVTTTKVAIEQRDGKLALISPTPRGGPGETTEKIKRTMRLIQVPHFEIDDAVMADEVQGVRAFGSEQATQTVTGVVDQRMADNIPYFDATLESTRVGAWKGVITYADGSSLDLFNLFDVSQEATVYFYLSESSPTEGTLLKKCMNIVRTTQKNLGAMPMTGIMGLCGDNFWDRLITHSEIRDTFKYQEGAALRAMGPWRQLNYGGITFENYRGYIGDTPYIDTDLCHFAPMGVPNFFRTVFAPADYMETVNTVGLPRYSKMIPMDNDKGVRLELQSNPLSYCRMPKALMVGSDAQST